MSEQPTGSICLPAKDDGITHATQTTDARINGAIRLILGVSGSGDEAYWRRWLATVPDNEHVYFEWKPTRAGILRAAEELGLCK